MKKLILNLGLIAALCWPAAAGETITYQGRLKEGGVPVDDNRNFVFEFCATPAPSGCVASPSGTQSFQVANGLFKSTFTAPSVNFAAGPWYLRVKVGADYLSPLEKLTAVPYSVQAASAAYASALAVSSGEGIFASTNVTVAGALTVSDFSVTPSTESVLGVSTLLQNLNPGVKDTGVAVTGYAQSASPDAKDILVGGNFEAEVPSTMNGGMIGVRAVNRNYGSSPRGVGLLVDSVQNSGTIAETYGILISTMTGGTQSSRPFALYSEDANALTHFAGPVGISSVPAYSLAVSSANGNLFWVAQDGVYATKFVGDGSGLTGVTGASGTDNTKVLKAGDTMTGQLTIAGSTLTVIGPAGAATGVLWVSTSATQPILFVSTSGLAGINTGAPQYPLHIASRFAQTALQVDGHDSFWDTVAINSKNGGNPNFSYMRAGILKANTYVDGSGRFAVSVNGADRLLITQDGKVGVGAAAPLYGLHISSGGGEAGNLLVLTTGTANVVRMTGDGSVYANRYYGSGTALTGVQADLANAIGTLDIGDGGTGATTAPDALANLGAMPASGGAMAGTLTLSPNTAVSSTSLISHGLIISTSGSIATYGPGTGTVDGNLRGLGAVDLQTARTAGTHVASGNFSGVLSGYANTAAGIMGAVAGGNANNASGQYSFVGSGNNNIASGDYSTVPGGDNSQASGMRSFAAGHKAHATASGSFIWADGEGTAVYNSVTDQARFKTRGGFLVSGSTNPAMTGQLNRGFIVTGDGLVGISTGAPGAALDVVPTATAAGVYSQIWRNASGVIVASMSSAGNMTALRYVGDGSGLTGVTGALGTDVTKVAKAGDTMTGQLTLTGSSLTISNLGTNLEFYSDVGAGNISVPTGEGLHFEIGGSDRMLIDNLGKVAIAKTPANYLLDVGGAANFDGQIIAAGTMTVAGNAFSVGGSTLVARYGYVGIGTQNPTAPFHVETNGSGINLSNISGDLTINTVAGVYGKTFFNNNSSGSMRFGVNYDETLAVATMTRVGVGTMYPQYRLHVSSAAGTAGVLMAVSTGTTDLFWVAGDGAYAAKFTGDGSGLSNVPGDNLGTHNASQSLELNWNNINTVSTMNAVAVNSQAYLIYGSTVVAVSGTRGTNIGIGAGQGNTGTNNVFVGNGAGYDFTDGLRNTYVGVDSGHESLSATENTFVGMGSGYQNTTGGTNSYLGAYSAYYNKYGSANTVLGVKAAGFNSGVDNSFSSTTVVGYQAGYNLASGSGDNTLLGWRAGYEITSGSGNVIIGYGQTTSAPAASNELNIGGVLFGRLDSRTVGISTRVPEAALDVVSTGTLVSQFAQVWRDSNGLKRAGMTATGEMLAAKFIGDGSGLTGVVAAGGVQKIGDTMTGQLTLAGSTLTVTGNAFSVGGSTFTVAAGRVGIGTQSTQSMLEIRGENAGGYLLLVATAIAANRPSLAVNSDGIVSVGTISPSTQTLFHAYAEAADHSIGVEDVTLGLVGTVRVAGSGAEDSAAGAHFEAEVEGNADIGIAAGLHASVRRKNGTGNIGKAMGVFIEDFGNEGGGTITNTYGVYLGTLTTLGQTNLPYALYSDDPQARTYFAGRVGISSAAPAHALVVSSAAGSSDLMLVVSTGSSVIFGVKGNGEVYTAGKFIGDGSMLTGITASGDSLGTHTATTQLNMASYGLTGVSSISAYGSGITFSTGTSGASGIFVSTSGALYTLGLGNGTFEPAARGIGSVDLQTRRELASDNVAGGSYSTIAGGQSNKIQAGATQAFIGGGDRNIIYNSQNAVLTGGYGNTLYSSHGTIGGGYANIMNANAAYGTIAGGKDNVVSSQYGAVLGGVLNRVNDNASEGAVIVGGQYNTAVTAMNSFTGGYQALSTANGVFTWADHNGPQLENKVANRTVFKSRGGFVVTGSTNTANITGQVNRAVLITDGTIGVSTGTPQAALDVVSTGTAAGIYAQIWRDGAGAVVASMTSTGNMDAALYLIKSSTMLAKVGTTSIAVGPSAGQSNTGANNTFVGHGAGRANTSAGGNVFVGDWAGVDSTGGQNTFVGSNAGITNTTGGQNTFVGQQAGYWNLGGDQNAFFGAQAGNKNTSGGGNSYFGYYAGYNGAGSNAAGNSFFGNSSGAGNTTGGQNVFLGNWAGYSNTTASNNVYVGAESARFNVIGAGNVYVGYHTGGYGPFTAFNSSSSTLLGYEAGHGITSGSADNVLIGFRAGYDVAAGTGNIVVGYDQDTSAPSASNELNIGGVLFGDLAARTLGISTRAPQAALDVVSTGTAINVYAQVWRNSFGVVVASMTSNGKLTTLQALPGDSLGTHIATQDLNMSAYNVSNVAKLGVGAAVDASYAANIYANSPGVVANLLQLSNENSTGTGMRINFNDIGVGSLGAITVMDAGAGVATMQFEQFGVGEAMRLQRGNLGLGTNNPTAKFEVSGGTVVFHGRGEDVYVLKAGDHGIIISTGGAIQTTGLGHGVFPGSQRGLAATDLQTYRTAGSMIASGDYSVVAGGAENTAGAIYSAVGGGIANNNTGPRSVISGGSQNNIATSFGAIAGGSQNNISAGLYGAIGGGSTNQVQNNYAAILGGSANTAAGEASAVAGGMNNRADGQYGFVGGGYQNEADQTHSAVVGGWFNQAMTMDSFVGGGYRNTVNASGSYASVVGGSTNTASGLASAVLGGVLNTAGGAYSLVVGGSSNTVESDGIIGFVGGGSDNHVLEEGGVVVGGSGNYAGAISQPYASVVGGFSNRASGDYSFVGGGIYNSAIGWYSAVPGGYGNAAKGNYSFAAGYRSSSTAEGTFTWNDANGPEYLNNNVLNQVMFKASGGFWVSTGSVYGTPALYVSPNNNVVLGTAAVKSARLTIVEPDTSSPTGNRYVLRTGTGTIPAMLSVSTSGVVSMDSQSMVIASAPPMGLSIMNWNVINTWSMEEMDTQMEMSSDRFTARNPGRYLVTLDASMNCNATLTTVGVGISQNGTPPAHFSTTKGANGQIGTGISKVYNLKAGEYLQFYYYTDQVTSITNFIPEVTITKLN